MGSRSVCRAISSFLVKSYLRTLRICGSSIIIIIIIYCFVYHHIDAGDCHVGQSDIGDD